jgi:L-alanine-DL-glutamate epimerase-like enolase superfamily enzyme
MVSLRVEIERFPIAGSFTISRGSRTEAVVVVAEVSDGSHVGRGECVPYARYGETVGGVQADILAQAPALAAGADRAAINAAMKPGAARNALDCALWDLEAKRAGVRVWEIAGLPAPQALTTAYTLSLGDPAAMEAAARAAAHRPLLKVKLGGEGDPERIAAVRRGAPASALIVDANEAWSAATLFPNLAACERAGVVLIEQPLPAADDAALDGVSTPILICADESLHDRASLAKVAKRYGAINIKLDKAGGLTEALALAAEAERLGLTLMVGCMLATSLGMAPAVLVAQRARFVDLDGPLLLARDREPGLSYEASLLRPFAAELWG